MDGTGPPLETFCPPYNPEAEKLYQNPAGTGPNHTLNLGLAWERFLDLFYRQTYF